MSFPYVVEADGGVDSDIAKIDVIGLTKQHGAVLLRGYPIHTPTDFARLSNTWGIPTLENMVVASLKASLKTSVGASLR